jgi:hypothetical protein
MKLRLMIASSLFLALISVAHIQLNIGWDELGDKLQVMLGHQRRTLQVGFLPVT